MKGKALKVTCHYAEEGEELCKILLTCFQHFLIRELEIRKPVAEHHVGSAQ